MFNSALQKVNIEAETSDLVYQAIGIMEDDVPVAVSYPADEVQGIEERILSKKRCFKVYLKHLDNAYIYGNREDFEILNIRTGERRKLFATGAK